MRRLFALPRRRDSMQRDIEDEIRFHLDSRAAELVEAGLPADAAREQAVAEYGDLAASSAELARVDGGRIERMRWTDRLEAIRTDVAYAVRVLRKQPGFTAAVIIVLALGIGANATMFGVIDRLLLRAPAQIGAPERVVNATFVRSSGRDSSMQDVLSYPIFMDLRSVHGAFENVAAYTPVSLAVGTGSGAQSVSGMRVSANFFSTLETHPAAGRFFTPDEEGSPTAPDVAVISYGYWQSEFGGTMDVVGRTLQLGQSKFSIVGVAPKGFNGVTPARVSVWIPITAGVSSVEYAGWMASRNGYWLMAVARLRAGESTRRAIAKATQALRSGEQLSGVSAARMAGERPRIGLLSILPREALANDPDARVALLLAAVSLLVAVIACANVANLQLARALRRRREVAIRIALGVSRRRLVAQLLVESVLLALVGGAAALVVSRLGSELLRRVLFTTLDWDTSIVEPRILAYTAVAALVAGTLTGILPASYAWSLDLTTSLKAGVREGRVHRSRARVVLLVAQTTLSVLLLTGTGLFIQSLKRIRELPIGMEPDRVLVADVRTTGMQYTSAQEHALYDRLFERAGESPLVEVAALATSLPFYSSWGTQVRIPGRDSVPTVKDGGPYFNAVTVGYFRAMGMQVLRGRTFSEADRAGTQRVVVVNESISRLWWPGEDAIGKCMKIGADTAPCTEVVGIVANSRRQSLIEDASLQFFLPIEQAPSWVGSRVLLIRPRGSAGTVGESLRRRLQVAEPGLPFVRVRPLADLVNPETRSWRLGVTMFAAFGSLALLLVAVGIYSMLAYDVGQRTHELGVRVALGARLVDITGTVVSVGVRLVAAGIGAGLVLTLLAGKYVEPLLFRTSPREPAVLISVAAVLGSVAILAMLVPVWRAARVDPIVALRAD